jgi:hypothetical protein
MKVARKYDVDGAFDEAAALQKHVRLARPRRFEPWFGFADTEIGRRFAGAPQYEAYARVGSAPDPKSPVRECRGRIRVQLFGMF